MSGISDELRSSLMVVAKDLIDGWKRVRERMSDGSKLKMDRMLDDELRMNGQTFFVLIYIFALCLCSQRLLKMFVSIV